MNVQPYLSFEGRAQEAMDFYKTAIGAKVDVVMLFKDAPPDMQANMPNKDKVMHAAFHVGDTQIMATDGQCSGDGLCQRGAVTQRVEFDQVDPPVAAGQAPGELQRQPRLADAAGTGQRQEPRRPQQRAQP